MKNTTQITKIDDILEKYDAFIIDIWGVIYDGLDPYPGSIEAINKLIAHNKSVTFLSNTPRPSEIIKERLFQWGVNMNKASVYTSGDAVREQLQTWEDPIFSNLGKNFYHLGEEKNKDILSGLNVSAVNQIEEADFMLLTIYLDEGEDMEQYDLILKKARDLNLSVICANPDIKVTNGDGIRYCAGSFGRRYQNLGGEVHYYGKPDSKIFEKILAKIDSIGIKDKNKILMIGDTMETDITGAGLVGIDSLLVLSGNGKEAYRNINSTNKYKFKPTWILSNLGENQ